MKSGKKSCGERRRARKRPEDQKILQLESSRNLSTCRRAPGRVQHMDESHDAGAQVQNVARSARCRGQSIGNRMSGTRFRHQSSAARIHRAAAILESAHSYGTRRPGPEAFVHALTCKQWLSSLVCQDSGRLHAKRRHTYISYTRRTRATIEIEAVATAKPICLYGVRIQDVWVGLTKAR